MGRKGKKQSNKDEKENPQEESQRNNPRGSRDQQSQQYQSRDSLLREPQPSHRGDHETQQREPQTSQWRESQQPHQTPRREPQITQTQQKETQPPQRRWQQSRQREEYQIKDQQTQRRDIQETESQVSQRKDFQTRENQQKKQSTTAPFTRSNEESFPSLQSGSEPQITQTQQKETQPPQRRWQQSRQREDFQIKDQQTQRRDIQETESQVSQRKDFQPRENQQKKQSTTAPFTRSNEESFPSLQSGSDQQKLPKEAWGKGRGRGRGKERNQTVQAEPGASNTGPTESMNQQKTPKEAWVRETGSINTAQAEPGISRISNETMPKDVPVQTDKNTKQKDMSQKTSTSKSMAKVTPPTTELAKLTVQTTGKFEPPKRKIATKAGSLGTPIRVLTNMMEIKFGAKFPDTVFHYNMVFDPDKPKYLFRNIFEQAVSMNFPNRYPAFDGKKNAYSSRKLFEGRTLTVENVTVRNTDNIEKVYKVTFELANIIDVRWLKSIRPGLEESEREIVALQAINTILAQAAVKNAISVGRSYFTTPPGHVHNRSYLGGGMDLWVGMFQSAVVGWKPFLNVDVAHKGFPRPQNVIDLIKILCFERPRDNANVLQNSLTANDIERNRRKINDFLKGLRVKTVVNGVTRSRQVVNELTKKIPKEDFFEGPNNAQISVQTYFERVKNYRIQYPAFPCLWIGPRTKNNHVPLEVCVIEDGQAIQRKLNEAQTSSMIRSAATGTQEREDKIMRVFNAVNHNRDNCIKNEFDIKVNGQFQEVDARILEPPKLLYNNRSVNVNKGVWDTSAFFQPTQAISAKGSWTILNCNEKTRDADIRKFSDYLRRAGRQVGMDIGEPLMPIQFIRIRETREGTVILKDLQNYFDDLLKQKVLFVIVIFNDFQKCSYSVIKQVAELKVGILTQCIKSFTVERKLNDSTIKNILQKINAKLNGTNHKFDPTSRPKCLSTPCMIVGADVTHPSPDARNIPSIAAVAASHDPNAFQYNIELRLQPPREEIILDLENIMLIQLKYFYDKTRHQPQKIVFFRDGVSEGQFRMVMERELTAIRSACKKLNPNYEPKITFLVVQKRHHIRMFPINRKDSDDKHFNVKAGTVVDTLITHPSDIDFYLVSHASIQGTARPTKYRCLWDDSNMSEDEIETLTYFLCHMFTRCTRSVSYPTPTYYAHLAAFRARNLTNNVDINLNNLAAEQRLKLSIKESVLKEKPMFFV